MRPDDLEISDMVVAYDPETLQRLPVRRSVVLDDLERRGNRRAAAIVRTLPVTGDELDAAAIDRLLIAVHCELQGISEVFHHGQRVAELLHPLVQAMRDVGAPRPFRVVDVGCGTGYVVRWLTAKGGLPEDVELLGVDYNAALVAEARRLAALEGLRCEFLVKNAFRLAPPAAIYLSSGVVHHFRGDGLVAFLAGHQTPTTQAFAHFDFQPWALAPLGAWLFHQVHMREPLSRYDGVLSAVRAHPGNALLEAAARGAPEFRSALYNRTLGASPIPRAMQTLLGVRPALWDPLVARLPRSGRLEPPTATP